MKRNIGDGERLIRAILGIYTMLMGFLFIQGVVGAVLGIVGLIAFATGATGWSGIYTWRGKSTLKVAPAAPEPASPEPGPALPEPEQPVTENTTPTDESAR
ncbi:MAG TPA: DUF2892 domain-containing protein [Anaerolineae bacterium]|nr:DUF2892 domain-containing protein [Anaerolineae bacterium]HQH38881.1 DUF2892 domain-containing protein [Anaerolineae bacterium]